MLSLRPVSARLNIRERSRYSSLKRFGHERHDPCQYESPQPATADREERVATEHSQSILSLGSRQARTGWWHKKSTVIHRRHVCDGTHAVQSISVGACSITVCLASRGIIWYQTRIQKRLFLLSTFTRSGIVVFGRAMFPDSSAEQPFSLQLVFGPDP